MAKILCVDDSLTIRNLVKLALNDPGVTVIEACHGIEGLEKLKLNPDIELIICDVNMPEMDGLTMCQVVQDSKDFANKPPILMLTSETRPELRTQGKLAGAVGWMVKPFQGEKLRQAVDTLLKIRKNINASA